MNLFKQLLNKIFNRKNTEIMYTPLESNSFWLHQKDIQFHCDFFGTTSVKNITPIKMFEIGALSIEDLYEFRKNSSFSEEVIEYLKNNFPYLYEKYSFELNLTGF